MRELALTILAGLTALAANLTGSTAPQAGFDADAIRARTCGYAAYAAVVPVSDEVTPDESPDEAVPEKPSQPTGESNQAEEAASSIADVAIDLLAMAKESEQAPATSKPPEQDKSEPAKPEKSVVVEKPQPTDIYRTYTRRVWIKTGRWRGYWQTRTYRVREQSTSRDEVKAGHFSAPAPVYYYRNCGPGGCR